MAFSLVASIPVRCLALKPLRPSGDMWFPCSGFVVGGQCVLQESHSKLCETIRRRVLTSHGLVSREEHVGLTELPQFS